MLSRTHQPQEAPQQAALARLATHADTLRRHKHTRHDLIDAARATGLTWRQIADALQEGTETVRVQHATWRTRQTAAA